MPRRQVCWTLPFTGASPAPSLWRVGSRVPSLWQGRGSPRNAVGGGALQPLLVSWPDWDAQAQSGLNILFGLLLRAALAFLMLPPAVALWAGGGGGGKGTGQGSHTWPPLVMFCGFCLVL